jgi:hypothetical protein
MDVVVGVGDGAGAGLGGGVRLDCHLPLICIRGLA